MVSHVPRMMMCGIFRASPSDLMIREPESGVASVLVVFQMLLMRAEGESSRCQKVETHVLADCVKHHAQHAQIRNISCSPLPNIPPIHLNSDNLRTIAGVYDSFPSFRPLLSRMSPPTDRDAILASFRKQIQSGKAIVGAGAGKSSQTNDNVNHGPLTI